MARNLQDQIGWYRKVQWSLGGLLLLAVVAFYVFGYMPGHRTQYALAQRADKLNIDLSSAQQKAAMLPTVELNVENLRLRLDRYNRQLPRQRELGEFHNEVMKLIQQANLRKPNSKPGAARQDRMFAEMPITLTFEGDFPAVCTFLRQAESMQRLTGIRSVNLRTIDAERGIVSVQMIMSIFYTEG